MIYQLIFSNETQAIGQVKLNIKLVIYRLCRDLSSHIFKSTPTHENVNMKIKSETKPLFYLALYICNYQTISLVLENCTDWVRAGGQT